MNDWVTIFKFQDHIDLVTGTTKFSIRNWAQSWTPNLHQHYIFMGNLEKILDSVSLKPWLWWRCLDDIFCIWTHGRVLLFEFLDFLNNFHITIKFTSTVSNASLSFHDVLVSVNNGCIFSDFYCKLTDTHQYLDRKSNHPFHIKKAIPYSQALRLRRICSDGNSFEKRAGEMKNFVRY